MKELQRTYYSPICKRNGSTGDLLSQTDSLDGMGFIDYFIRLTNFKILYLFYEQVHIIIIFY